MQKSAFFSLKISKKACFCIKMHKYAKIIYFNFLIHTISYSILFLLFLAQNSTIEYEKEFFCR